MSTDHKPLTMTAERESAIRRDAAKGMLTHSVISLLTEIEALRAKLREAEEENIAHREQLGRFLNTVNPVGFDFDMKAEEAFEYALACVVADRELAGKLKEG